MNYARGRGQDRAFATLTKAAGPETGARSNVAALTGPRLVVFLHFAVKQNAMQSELQAALPGLVVTAVGRVGDLDRALEEGQDAVMTLPPVIAEHGLTVALQGIREGATDELYSLVGVGQKPNPKSIESVGSLDLLGRTGTTTFVNGLLGTPCKVVRVTKIEDLVSLLQMERVNAVMLPARLFRELQATTRLSLVATDVGRVGLPVVASIGAKGAEAIAAIRRLPEHTCRELGIDSWR